MGAGFAVGARVPTLLGAGPRLGAVGPGGADAAEPVWES